MIFYNKLKHIAKLLENDLDEVLSVLSEDNIEMVFKGFTRRRRVYPIRTLLYLFLTQVASGCSLRDTIARGINQEVIPLTASPLTSAYSNARNRLDDEKLKTLFKTTGRQLEEQAKDRWMFQGRCVKVVDGTSFTLPDTPQNQSEYPQPSEQKDGCGFPLMCASVMIGLESGAIIDAETTGGTGYERPMFRKLWRSLECGDIVLGDGLYGSYAEIAKLSKRGVDGVFERGNKKFHREDCIRIGENEWLYRWKCPAGHYKWVKRSELPDSIAVRVIKFTLSNDGYKSKPVIIYTTLLDSDKYPKEDIIEMYRRRWEMELRLRDIKTTMKLEMLSCKTPARCRGELWMGILLYNLVRMIMLDVAIKHKICMSRLSFAGSLCRVIEASMGQLGLIDPHMAYRVLTRHIAEDIIPYRPFRVEPRKLKRRSKSYGSLTKPREIVRQLIKISHST